MKPTVAFAPGRWADSALRFERGERAGARKELGCDLTHLRGALDASDPRLDACTAFNRAATLAIPPIVWSAQLASRNVQV